MRQQYEEAAKRHIQWHRQNKDTWPISVFEIVTGERTGQYAYGVGGRHWKDFNHRGKVEEADMADYYATVGQYVESMNAGYYLYQPDLSRSAPRDLPRPLIEVMRYHLKMDGVADFLQATRKIHDAIQKTDWPAYYDVYLLFNGGEHPTYVFMFPRKNWADFEPPEVSFMAMLEKAYGREEATSVMNLMGKSVHCVHSEIAASRPDMSYVPETK